MFASPNGVLVLRNHHMRAAAMCFSFLQAPPGCKIYTLAGSLRESICKIRRGLHTFDPKRQGPSFYGLEGGSTRKWSRRSITTKTRGRKNILSSEASNISQQLLEGKLSIDTKSNLDRLEITKHGEGITHSNCQEKIAESLNLAKLTTVIVFDIETTGLSRENERIIEIAMQDLAGGENSTFQTLVNPERAITNPYIHGISTYMVNKPGVPSMKQLIPILLGYVRSRQKPGGQILLVAHNCWTFDVPFLIYEFNRHSYEIPPDWLFIDTVPLARQLLKAGGEKVPSGYSLLALREFFGIPLIGSAHRAMSDVYSLSLIFQKLTFALKLPISALLEDKTFTASACMDNIKKKKSK